MIEPLPCCFSIWAMAISTVASRFPTVAFSTPPTGLRFMLFATGSSLSGLWSGRRWCVFDTSSQAAAEAAVSHKSAP